jgi:hypothetical protein
MDSLPIIKTPTELVADQIVAETTYPNETAGSALKTTLRDLLIGGTKTPAK